MTRPCTLPSKPWLLFHIQHMSLSACGNMPGIDVVWYVPDICRMKLKDAAETPSYTFCLDPLIHKHCWLGASGELFYFFYFFCFQAENKTVFLRQSQGLFWLKLCFSLSRLAMRVGTNPFTLTTAYLANQKPYPNCNFGHICCYEMGLWKVCDVAFKGALGLHPVQKQRGFGPNWWQQRPNSAASLFHADIVHILGHICPSVSWNCCWHPYKHWTIAHAIICTWIWF